MDQPSGSRNLPVGVGAMDEISGTVPKPTKKMRRNVRPSECDRT